MKIALEGRDQIVEIPDGTAPAEMDKQLRSYYTPDELYGSTTYGERQSYRIKKGRSTVTGGKAFWSAMDNLSDDPAQQSEVIQKSYSIYNDATADFTPENDEKYSARSFGEKFVGASAELAPYMLDSAVESIKYGEYFGAAAATAALIGGQAGPQAALPEEVITVPAAYLMGKVVGQVYGSWMNATQVEGGMVFKELLDNGVEPKTAKQWAVPAGYLIGAVEMLQLKQMIPVLGKVGRKEITDIIKNAAKKKSSNLAVKMAKFGGRLAKNMAIYTATEVPEEIIQENIAIIAEMGAAINDEEAQAQGYAGPTNEDILQRNKDTLIQSLLGFPLLGLPGAVHTSIQSSSKERMVNRVLTARAKESLSTDLAQHIEEASQFNSYGEYMESIDEKVDDKYANNYGFDNRTLFTEAIWKAAEEVKDQEKTITKLAGEKAMEGPSAELQAAMDRATKLAESLGVNIDSIEYVDEDMVLDPADPMDKQAIIANGYTEKEIEDAIKTGERFIIAGEFKAQGKEGGSQRTSVRLFRGATEQDAYHEIVVHGLEHQGGLPGWAGTAEEHARYLEGVIAAGKEATIIELTPEGSRVNTRVGDILGPVNNSIRLVNDGVQTIEIGAGAEIVEPSNMMTEQADRTKNTNKEIKTVKTPAKVIDTRSKTDMTGREGWTKDKKGDWRNAKGQTYLAWYSDKMAERMRSGEVEVVQDENGDLYFTSPGLEAYKYNAPLKNGNVKVKAYILDMPAVYTCKNCVGCAPTCYAVGAQIQYPDTKLGRFANLYLFMNHRDTFHTKINEQLRKNEFSAVRLHSSGDIFSQRYLSFLEDIVKENPDKTFYVYTKVGDYDYDSIDQHENFNRVNSVMPDGQKNYGDMAYIKKASKEYGVKICPASVAKEGVKVICAADDYKGSGVKCSQCMRESYMLFQEHGQPQSAGAAKMQQDIRDTNFMEKIQHSIRKTGPKNIVPGIKLIDTMGYDWETIKEDQGWTGGDGTTIKYWKNKILNGDKIPPILLIPGTEEIFDGLHRAKAYAELGKLAPAIELTEKGLDIVTQFDIGTPVEKYMAALKEEDQTAQYAIRRTKAVIDIKTGVKKEPDLQDEYKQLKRIFKRMEDTAEDIHAQAEKEKAANVKWTEAGQKLADDIHYGEKLAQAKAREKKLEGFRDKLRQFAIDNLKGEDRGKFLTAVSDIKTEQTLDKAMEKVKEVAEASAKKDMIRRIKQQLKRIYNSKSISVDYIQKIQEMMDDYEMTGHTAKTIKRLEATLEFLGREAAAGRKVDMPSEILSALEILARKPVKDLTLVDLQDIHERIRVIADLGKTKLRSRKAAVALMKERDLLAIQKDSKAVTSKKVKEENAITGRMSGVDRTGNALKKALNLAQMKDLVLHPMDALFDLLDGMKEYSGANYRIFKRRVDMAFSIYLDMKFEIQNRIDKLANDLDLTTDNMERIGVYAAKMQEGGMEKLLAFFTEDQVNSVQLTDKELKFYNAMRDELDRLREPIEKVMREVYNRPLGQVKNYFPFMTDFDAMSDAEMRDRFGDKVITLSDTLKKNVEMGFTITRKGGKNRIKINAAEIFGKHVDNAIYLITVGKETKYLGELAGREEYGQAVGDVGQEIVREWVDLLARKGVSQGDRVAALDLARKYTGLVALGFKLSSTIVQLTSLMDGAAMIGTHAFDGFSRIIKSAEWRAFVIDNMPEIRARIGDDVAFQDFGKDAFAKKLGDMAYKPLQVVDRLAATGVAAGAYIKYCKDNNIPIDLENPDPEGIAYAQKMGRRTQSSSQFKDLPLAITKGKLTGNISVDKAILQFQSFMLNRWSLIRHDLWRNGIMGKNKKQAINIAMWLIAANYAEMGLRKWTKEAIAGMMGQELPEDDEDKAFYKDLGQILQNIPFMGSIYYAMLYEDFPVPVVSMLKKILGKFGAAVKAEDDKGLKFIKALLASVPGGQQIEPMVKGE
jgi:hypothetical protein